MGEELADSGGDAGCERDAHTVGVTLRKRLLSYVRMIVCFSAGAATLPLYWFLEEPINNGQVLQHLITFPLGVICGLCYFKPTRWLLALGLWYLGYMCLLVAVLIDAAYELALIIMMPLVLVQAIGVGFIWGLFWFFPGALLGVLAVGGAMMVVRRFTTSSWF
ncbi:hypothetical protein [Mucisphaera sp.]|uniref:hypothetical protein n=1 Tax=Mucisphaera sp. TaxID=2913024 RepID=UPI003D11B4F0